MPTVLSLLGINPHRIGSEESFIRELSLQLGRAGWDHVVCYSAEPPEAVRKFLELPNLRIEVLKTVESLSWASATGVWRLLHKYRPRILHLHFLGFLGPYPWMARLASVEKLFFTDQGSRPANYVAARAPLWKRFLTRMIDWPITKVICVSNYGYQVFSACDLLPRDRFTMIYNSVDVARVRCESSDGMTFRRKYGIPDNAPLVVQVSWIIPEKGIP